MHVTCRHHCVAYQGRCRSLYGWTLVTPSWPSLCCRWPVIHPPSPVSVHTPCPHNPAPRNKRWSPPPPQLKHLEFDAALQLPTAFQTFPAESRSHSSVHCPIPLAFLWPEVGRGQMSPPLPAHWGCGGDPVVLVTISSQRVPVTLVWSGWGSDRAGPPGTRSWNVRSGRCAASHLSPVPPAPTHQRSRQNVRRSLWHWSGIWAETRGCAFYNKGYIISYNVCVCVYLRLPPRFQARQSQNAAILSVDLKHALGLRPLGKWQHVIGVAVGGINLTDRAALEGVCYHDNEDFQGGDAGLVLTVPNDPQKYPGGGGKRRLTRVTCLRDQNTITVKRCKTQINRKQRRNSSYLHCQFADYNCWLITSILNLYFKGELSGGFRAKHTIRLQRSSLVQGEETSLTSRNHAKLKRRAVSQGVFIADW